MTTRLSAPTPAHLLALMPRLIGFVPEASLVILPFVDGRTTRALRVDLPLSWQRPGDVASALVEVIRALPRVEAAVSVYIDACRVQDCEARARDLGVALHRAAEDAGIVLRDALVQGSDGWYSLVTERAGALDDIARAADDYGDVVRVPSRAEALQLADDPHRAAAVQWWIEQLDDESAAAIGLSALARELYLRPTAEPPSARVCAEVCWHLRNAEHRAAMRAVLLVSRDPAERDDAASRHDQVAALAGLGRAPELLDERVAFLRILAGAAPFDVLDQALALLAWAHWARGEGTLAHHLAEWSACVDQGSGAGASMLALFARVPLPEWLLSSVPSWRTAAP